MTKIPYQIGSETSRLAAQGQRGKAKADIQRIYDLLRDTPGGLTTDEIRIALGMLASTAGARRRDLEQMGGCKRTAERRRTSAGSQAFVYVHVEGADLDKKPVGRPRKDRKNNVKVSVYMTPQLHDALVAETMASGVDVSVYIRQLLDNDLQERKRQQELHRQLEWGQRFGNAVDILTGGE